jgi:putative ABC transport system ATP-binding protein
MAQGSETATAATLVGSPRAGQAVSHIQRVSKIYVLGELQVQALREVDFDLYQGEFVVLVGPSGSGMSTRLNILGALDAPTSGEVIFYDHHLTAADDRERARYRREHVGLSSRSTT